MGLRSEVIGTRLDIIRGAGLAAEDESVGREAGRDLLGIENGEHCDNLFEAPAKGHVKHLEIHSEVLSVMQNICTNDGSGLNMRTKGVREESKGIRDGNFGFKAGADVLIKFVESLHKQTDVFLKDLRKARVVELCGDTEGLLSIMTDPIPFELEVLRSARVCQLSHGVIRRTKVTERDRSEVFNN